MKYYSRRFLALFVTLFVTASAVVSGQDEESPLVKISGNNGRFVSSENGEIPIACNRFEAFAWELFRVIELEDGVVAFLGSNGRYLSVQEDGATLDFSAEVIGLTETFTIVDLDGQIALLGSNGGYVSSENGAKPMTCNRRAIGPWERFSVELLDTEQ